jgi:hypothetical protein
MGDPFLVEDDRLPMHMTLEHGRSAVEEGGESAPPGLTLLYSSCVPRAAPV